MATKSLWDHVNQIKDHQEPNYWETLSEADKRTFSTYMINRVLSMRKELCGVINQIQHLTEVMSDEMVHKLYTSLLPPDSSYYPYIKKQNASNRISWVVEKLAEHFECSKLQAREYYDVCMVSPEKKRQLVEFMKSMYPLTKDQIKQLDNEITGT